MFDFPGDVCERCRHVLSGDTCPSCGWMRARVEGERPPYAPDEETPGIAGW